jgi:hypothetical protein
MLRFVVFSLLVFAAALGLVAGARAAGQQQTPSPAYLDTGDCEQPCWFNVRPGISRVSQFLTELRTRAPYTGHATDQGDEVITMFEISTFGAITLADVLREFGPPERVGCLGLGHTTLYANHSMVTTTEVYYAGGLVQVNLVHPDQRLHLSPDMQVRTIRYYAPGDPAYPIGTTRSWQGFASAGVYGACH